MSREAMQIALDALEANLGNWAAKTKAVKVLRQALKTEQKTAVSPGKGTGFNYFRALDINVLQPALETKQKTAVSPDGGTGFIDGVWHEPNPTAWRCQCGKAYTVTCISSKPKEKNA